MSRDDVSLLDVKRAGQLVADFTQGMSKEAFLSDIKTQSSVLYQLSVMGEAVKRLSPDLRVEHPEIPWAAIAGMRDHLIHGYDVVDWEQVRNTVRRDVPDVLNKLDPLLPRPQ